MNNTDSTRHWRQVLGWAALILSGLALYFQLTEPFAGTPVRNAARILGPVSTMMIGVSLIRQPRGRIWAWIGATIAVAVFLLLILGRLR